MITGVFHVWLGRVKESHYEAAVRRPWKSLFTTTKRLLRFARNDTKSTKITNTFSPDNTHVFDILDQTVRLSSHL